MTSPIKKPGDNVPPPNAFNLSKEEANRKEAEKAEKAAGKQFEKKESKAKVIQASKISIPTSAKHSSADELRKQAIDQNYPFFALLKIVNNPTFEKNPNRDQYIELFKRKFEKLPIEGYTVSPKVDLCMQILEGDQPAETMFKTIELILGNDFDQVFQYMADIFTEKLFTLIFQNPKYAQTLLEKHKDQIKHFPFALQSIKDVLAKFGSIGNSNHNDRFVEECLKVLFENPNVLVEHFKPLLMTLIHCDVPHTFKFLWSKIEDPSLQKKLVVEMLKWDSVLCLKEIVDCKPDKSIWEAAADYQASKCFAFLVKTYPHDNKDYETYAERFAENGNISMHLALCQNNEQEASQLLFSNIVSMLRNPAPYANKIEVDLKALLTKLLRYNPIHLVDKIVNTLTAGNQTAAEIVPGIYSRIREEFIRVAPFISRHTKTSHLEAIKSAYSLKKPEDAVAEEIEYAKFCRTHVEQLQKGLSRHQINKPASKEFNALPCSSTGTRRVAALVELIGNIRSEKQKERSGKHVASFKTLRSKALSTCIEERYGWASPLLSCIYEMSHSNDMNRKEAGFRHIENDPEEILKVYELRRNTQIMNQVAIERNAEGAQWWHHARLPVQATWQAVEDAFKGLMAFRFVKPSDNSVKSIEGYKSQLNAFYAKAAELVWLIGNTTPLERGSGTVAEWLLAIVHMQHGLEPPVLKPEFPQLDVLDITFPLSDYKTLFTYFFEPATLPEHMRNRWPDLSAKSTFAQLEELYSNIK